MKKWYIILFISIAIICILNNNNTQPTTQSSNNCDYTTYCSDNYVYTNTQSTVYITRKPTIGECIVAPIDFVVGICSGVIKGVGYGTAYIAETITPNRLYTEDNWCCYCDVQHDINCHHNN